MGIVVKNGKKVNVIVYGQRKNNFTGVCIAPVPKTQITIKKEV